MSDPYLVTPQWLEARLEDPALVVLDCSWFVPEAGSTGRDMFAAGHIPGARFIDLDAVSDATSPYVNMLCTPEVFTAEARALGVSAESTVIIYDAVYVSARLWWMFKTFGHQNVRILDGGLRRWKAEGRPLQTGPAAPVAPGDFTATAPRDSVVGWQDVLAASAGDGPQLVDARTPGRFTGEMSSGYPGVDGGHIPGAVNVSWQDLMAQSGDFAFTAPQEAAALFAAAGVDLDRPVIATCGSGVTACIIAFQLERLGKRDWKIYDGSWHEWGQRADLPKVSVK